MGKRKQHSKRIFSGKSVPFIGIKQGVGEIYRGDAVWFCMNVLSETSMRSRSGQTNGANFSGSIHNANVSSHRAVAEGTNIWSEEL